MANVARNKHAEVNEQRELSECTFVQISEDRQVWSKEQKMDVVVLGGMSCRRMLIDSTMRDPGATRCANVNKTGTKAAAEK